MMTMAMAMEKKWLLCVMLVALLAVLFEFEC
jgi:hypothetical protein